MHNRAQESHKVSAAPSKIHTRQLKSKDNETTYKISPEKRIQKKASLYSKSSLHQNHKSSKLFYKSMNFKESSHDLNPYWRGISEKILKEFFPTVKSKSISRIDNQQSLLKTGNDSKRSLGMPDNKRAYIKRGFMRAIHKNIFKPTRASKSTECVHHKWEAPPTRNKFAQWIDSKIIGSHKISKTPYKDKNTWKLESSTSRNNPYRFIKTEIDSESKSTQRITSSETMQQSGPIYPEMRKSERKKVVKVEVKHIAHN